MDAVEASGKTVEEAIEKALDELGAERDEVEVEVLAEGKGGILGVGGSDARVRVQLLSEQPSSDGAAPGNEAEPVPPVEGDEADGEYIEDEAELAAQMLDK